MKPLSSVVYAAASVPAAACGWTMVSCVSGISWAPEPAFFAVPFLFVGAVLLAACGWGLIRLERSGRPTPLDNARHCPFHYAGLTLLGGSRVAFFYGGGIAPAPVELGALSYTGLAVLADAPVSIYWRRRFDCVTGGSPA